MNYLISATISFTVSVVFNYLASMRYVFTHKQGLSRRREFVIFVVLSVIGLGVNDLLMWLGSSVLGVSYLIVKIGRHGHRHGLQLRDAQDLPRRRHRRRPRVANGRPLRFENELRTARLGRWVTRYSVLE